MKILLKRNQASGTSLPASLGSGEPLWFKDRLYIGSVGTTAGGAVASGTPVAIATSVTGQTELTLSTTAQTYLTVDGTTYSIKLPASATNSWRAVQVNGTQQLGTGTGTGALNFKAGSGMAVSYDNGIVYAHTNVLAGGSGTTSPDSTAATLSHGGTFNVPVISYDDNGHIVSTTTKTYTLPGSGDTNQKISVDAGSTPVTFGDNATVKFIGEKDIQIVGNATNNTITISHPTTYSAGATSQVNLSYVGNFTIKAPLTIDSYGHVLTTSSAKYVLPAAYTHPSYTAHSATGGLSGTTLTVPIVTNDATGHVSDLTSTTVEFKSAPTSSNKVLTETDVSGIVGAMVYQGTIGTGGTITTLPTASSTNKGHVYMVKTAGTYADKACEIGDMIVSNGASWDVINGENQVTNSAPTIVAGASNASTIATVDGTDITAKVSVTAGSATIASVASDIVTLKAGITQTGTTGTVANNSGSDITLAKVAKTGSYNDLSNKPTIPAAANDATLTVKTSTNTTASALFSANASNAGVLYIAGGNKIGTKNTSTTSNNVVTNTVTIDHATGETAGASKSSIGGVSGNTITVPIVSTDAYGHVSSLTSTTWTYTAPTVGDGKLQLQVGSGTAVDSGFTANAASATALKFSGAATSAKFAVDSSTKVISITEIDGGLID